MATVFPANIDTFNNLVANTSKMNVAPTTGTTVINLLNDSVLALETKVGVDSSLVTTSLSYKLGGVTGSDKAMSLTGAETATNKALTGPTFNGGVALTSTSTELNALHGTSVTPTQINNLFGKLLAYAGQSASPQSIPDTTVTTVVLDSETFDPNNNFASNTYTAPATGYYFISAQVTFSNPADQTSIQTILTKNLAGGGSTMGRHQYLASGTGTQGVNIIGIYALTAADTVTLRVFHNKGSAVNLANATTDTFFSISYISSQ